MHKPFNTQREPVFFSCSARITELSGYSGEQRGAMKASCAAAGVKHRQGSHVAFNPTSIHALYVITPPSSLIVTVGGEMLNFPS